MMMQILIHENESFFLIFELRFYLRAAAGISLGNTLLLRGVIDLA